MKIILDPGHSSKTPGKCSPDKRIMEYKWARELTALIETKLDALGISHQRTTTPKEDNTEISLLKRCKRANEMAKKEKCILVSIHCNASGNDGKWHDPNGWSVFVGLNASDRSKKLASLVASKAIASGIHVRRPDQSHLYWKQNLAICRDTSMPAILIENMFQDNLEDVEYLLSEEGKEILADIIVNGILDYGN